MMNRDLEWTEQLGDAFLSQQTAVMDSIQRLRRQAISSGALNSAAQQTVSTVDGSIEIQPTNPDVEYVPYYDPRVVYGPWLWPDYPPIYFYFPLPIDYALIAGGFIGFGLGIPVLGPFWGWHEWNWHHHVLTVGSGRNGAHAAPWTHDPAHRRGVPYRDTSTATRYQGPSDAARRELRGFPVTQAPSRPPPESMRRPQFTPPVAPQRPEQPIYRPAPAIARPAPPVFRSFPDGGQARHDSERGAASRSMPMPPAPRPQGGGNREQRPR